MLYSVTQHGFELGRYETTTAADALRSMAAELGYGDFAEYCFCEGLDTGDCQAVPALTRLTGDMVH